MEMFSNKKKNKPESDDEESAPAQGALSDKDRFPYIYASCFLFVAAFAYLQAFAHLAGKAIAYKVPIGFISVSATGYFIHAAMLAVAFVVGFKLETFSGFQKHKDISEYSRDISYFFSMMATLAVSVYLGYALVSGIARVGFLGLFYILILYGSFLGLHFLRGKPPLLHAFVSIGFMFVLIAVPFFGGLAKGKVEDKIMMTRQSESFFLFGEKDGMFLLTGFDQRNRTFNRMILLLDKNSVNDTVFYDYPYLND